MNESNYKIWHCEYYWHGSYGAYQETNCIVFANTKEEAIQLASVIYTDAKDGHKYNVQDWTATELDPDNGQCYHISSRSS